jgi:hypothetical protein
VIDKGLVEIGEGLVEIEEETGDKLVNKGLLDI